MTRVVEPPPGAWPADVSACAVLQHVVRFGATFTCCCCCPWLQVIQAFVRQAMSYLDATPDKETQVSLIKTLQTVTEGKVCTAPAWQQIRGPHTSMVPANPIRCMLWKHLAADLPAEVL